MSNIKETIRQRIGWESHLKPFLYKKLPSNLGWSATLGSLCAILFTLMAASGMFLAMYYSPSPDKAYQSIGYIMNDVPLGAILRGIHHWGAGAMVLAVFTHLATVFFSGSFKAPRELTWILGVCLFLVTLGLGFTGYLLPWDQKAFWATVVSSNIPKDLPVIGHMLTNLLIAGDGVSGLTLTRFYSIHMLILPAMMVFLIAGHIYLVRLHGVCEHASKEKSGKNNLQVKENRLYRFFPEHLARSSVVFMVVFGIILLLSFFGEIPKEELAGTLDESYLPRPEWYYMWLFQLLTYFSGSTEIIGSIGVPTIGVLLLFALPFLEKSNFLGAANRPLATAVGVTSIICIVYLSITGFAGARHYGDTILIPDRPLTQKEELGLEVYVKQDCAYCHHIQGRGGRRVGPDMANIKARGRTLEYLAAFIKDPQSQSSSAIMPKYDLKQEELAALSDFILSLDFNINKKKTIKKEDVIGETDGSKEP
ncbi:MAG: cytochrome b N-terminal domain-containing protein [Desulfobacterales bacterium]|nr:cytochrome b N-terminal domain-containing protein [Desulfobacterales bacterium]